ncbi:hypothetical protein BDV93DRAFT_563360 [Ceratobasidium sp. AG-I]|nr:hypothetical protein BDV93DRAFT_563360 [Ceratobasidium sp. AG-I]
MATWLQLPLVQTISSSNLSATPSAAASSPTPTNLIPGLDALAALIVLGGALETLRRSVSSVWEWVLRSFFLTIHLDNDDTAYDWMIIWLSLQPAWRKAREVQISSKDFGLNRSATIVVPGETDASGETRSVAYLPTYNSTHTMMYKRHWMRVTRTRQDLGEGCTRESLQISIFARDREVINQLLLEAKEAYTREDQNRVAIY